MNTTATNFECPAMGIREGKRYNPASDTVFPPEIESERLWGTAGELIDNILNVHHDSAWRYIHEVPAMFGQARGEGSLSNGLLDEIESVWEELADELTAHMRREEQVLFPFIRDLELSALHAFSLLPVSFVTVANPMSSIRAEHERETQLLDRLSDLTNRLASVEGMSGAQIKLAEDLRAFERNLRKHIQLENNVLFPLAMRLESELYYE